MTSAEIRQSFLDFFRSKGHTIVPSSSLMPDSPGLLFTNAGMNQFVPIFLNERIADVDKWPGAIPGKATRAADTQKCIRAGGKHNDLEDVGMDTYHHTFFEMLGNWSFGDYFKKEAIDWAWELITEVWKFPKNRLYATVYNPDKSKNDPSEFDQEAYDFWSAKFAAAGLDPKVHIVNGNKKDNFWMMGETGPCGPCSEIHVDLTPEGDTNGTLVNKGDARCIEIWNLVFIQFNANADGTFSPLPAKHVDTGMGFERVTGIIQNTSGFKHFTKPISNYETDIFRPIFDELEKLSGKKYGSTLPVGGVAKTDQEKIDVAFRVIADHIRTLSFSIADGILPGNNGRNYVLRRILRRAVRYGRALGFHSPFFYKLVPTLSKEMGIVFPELDKNKHAVEEIIRTEEESFNKTIDLGLKELDQYFAEAQEYLRLMQEKARSWEDVCVIVQRLPDAYSSAAPTINDLFETSVSLLGDIAAEMPASLLFETRDILQSVRFVTENLEKVRNAQESEQVYVLLEVISNAVKDVTNEFRYLFEHKHDIRKRAAFVLYDTFGFPLDLTVLEARQRDVSVDEEGFDLLMQQQKSRSRSAQKKEIIAASNVDTSKPTKFVGFETLQSEGTVLEVVQVKDKVAVTLDVSPMYAEMGGQVGDTGEAQLGANVWHVLNTQKTGNTFLHFLGSEDAPQPGDKISLQVNATRRNAIQRHHSVTHLLHWALHEVVSADATQKGSFVGPDKLTFDFSAAALTPTQVTDVERLVNERIVENGGVSWTEVPYASVKGRKDVMQFFGEKYGDLVRVVQIGGESGALNGYSMELCGGTHTRATGEIGLFRIVSESAVAAGIRRIEAMAGLRAYQKTREDISLISTMAGKLNSPIGELEKKIDSLLAHQKELEKQLHASRQKQAAESARSLIAKASTGAVPYIVENLGPVDGEFVQNTVDAIKGQFKGVIVLAGVANGAVSLVASVSPEFTAKFQAGKIIQAIAPIVGGKGGGKPDNARGGGKDAAKLDDALQKARELLTA